MRSDELIDLFLDWKLHNEGRARRTIDKYRGFLLALCDYYQSTKIEDLNKVSNSVEMLTLSASKK